MNDQAQEKVRSYLLRDKVFLKSIYAEAERRKRLLNVASDSQLKTLLIYLHFLSNGDIKMKKSHFIAIGNKKISILKKGLESKKKLQSLILEDRSKRLHFLNKICDNFGELLYPLFNEN